jgi:WD40 repeat protein
MLILNAAHVPPQTTNGNVALVASTSFTGHTNTIFALCYDETRDQVISGGKDGAVNYWTKEGKVKLINEK